MQSPGTVSCTKASFSMSSACPSLSSHPFFHWLISVNLSIISSGSTRFSVFNISSMFWMGQDSSDLGSVLCTSSMIEFFSSFDTDLRMFGLIYAKLVLGHFSLQRIITS
eukprot:TRINITY_DN23525_c0_g1_i1.p1 TRINITY_DN23525_c0_g1~~TRINITY_DN23525_c0_g1_i1.p1  ORF type:complete len:109 (+),score=0.15 TRINITY_DN23525_c0_g1_i1:241-567(+)